MEKNYDARSVEDRQSARWASAEIGRAKGAAGLQPFSMVMPPPNVTGQLHMGHALNMTIQDVVARNKRKNGHDVLWLPGTDHASIATHYVVERQLEKEGQDRWSMGRTRFVQRCEEWKDQSARSIREQITRLGCVPDWSRERFTLDEMVSKAVTRIFVQLYRTGKAYRGSRMVNWDPKFRTAISDLEVDQRQVKGNLWEIRYPLEAQPGEFIVVATTRPETLFGDTAVAVNPSDERYRHLVGKRARLPLTSRTIPIISDEYADPSQGTGAVKVTPAHDFNDFEVGRRHGLELISVMNEDGTLNDNVPAPYRGLDRFVARSKLLAALTEEGLLQSTNPRVISQPFGDRSGVVLEPMVTTQWFVDMSEPARSAIEAVKRSDTSFIPKSWERVFFQWLENIQPWCVSRQLWYGHRIPAWYGPDGREFVDETEELALAQAKAHYGSEVELRRDADVFDTWFSSALWPFATLGWPDDTPDFRRFYPTNLLVTGFDIIFFWVARMVMQGTTYTGRAPFKDVYIHGLVRDSHGQKMSKTKGNVIDPLELANEFGADATRLTLTSLCGQGQDIRFSKDAVTANRNFVRKLWNASRFCYLNEVRASGNFDAASCRLPMNRWIVGLACEAADASGRAIDEYRFNDAALGLYQFVWGSFCDWYIEFAKTLLQSGDEGVISETRGTLAWCLNAICHGFHPIIPFVTEEIWETFGNEGLVATAVTPDFSALKSAVPPAPDVELLVRFVSAVRTVRGELNVPLTANLGILLKDPSQQLLDMCAKYAAHLEKLAKITDVRVSDHIPTGSAQTFVDQTVVVIPLSGVVDLALEHSRLASELAKIESELGTISARLDDKEFVANAPKHIVELQVSRKNAAQQERHRVVSAMNRIKDAV